MNHRTATYILLKLVTLAWVAAWCFCSAAAHGQRRCYRLPDGRVVCEHPLMPERSPGYAWVRPVQPTQQATPAKYAAVVRISADESAGVSSWASGTIIDRDESGAYVVTASHLLDDWARREPRGRIIVQVQQQKYAATLLGRDPAIDVAILKILDPGVKPYPASDVVSGESWAGGYPAMHALRWVKGRFVSYLEQGQRRGSKVFTPCAVFTGATTKGHSGGPINQNGHFVAVIWGGDGREVYATPFPIIRKVLGHLVPCWRRKAGAAVAVQPNPPPILPGPGPPPEPLDEPLVPIVETPPNPQGPLSGINARLDKLEVMIEAIPAGAKGDTGQQGEKGDPGVAGELSENDLDELVAKVIAKLPPLPVRRLYMKRKGTPDPPVPVPADDTEWVPYHEDVDEVNWIDGEGLTIRTFPPQLARPAETAEGR